MGPKAKAAQLHTGVPTKQSKDDLPELRLLPHKLGHHFLTLVVIQDDDFLASVDQQLFAAHEAFVLADYHTLDLVEYAGTGTHVAG